MTRKIAKSAAKVRFYFGMRKYSVLFFQDCSTFASKELGIEGNVMK